MDKDEAEWKEGGEQGAVKKRRRRKKAVSPEEFKDRAKCLAVDALDRLGEIAMDPESAAQHAIPAGKVIIEYAYGRPGTEKETGPGGGIGRVDELIEAITQAARE